MSTPAYRFDLGETQLIYAPLADLAAVVNRADCHRLLTSTDLNGKLAQLRAMLLEDTARPGPCSGELMPPSLGIVTTRQCSMACTYCEFTAHHDGPAVLPGELAFAAIDDFARRQAAAGRTELPIHLFGGEPFDAWRLTQRIVARARGVARTLGLQPFFEATTNGFYPGERARWIAENLHRVVLSTDGPPALHDESRPDRQGRPTSHTVHSSAMIFSRGTVELNLRLCVSASTVQQLPESIIHLLDHLELLPTAIAVEPVRSLTPGARAPEPPSPAAFAGAFMDSLDLCEERGVLLQFSGADLGAKVASFCPVGRDGCIVHTDGTVAACYLPRQECLQRGLDLAYGRIDPEHGLVIAEDRLEATRWIAAEANGRCRSCFCRWHCAGGCHVYRAGQANDPDWCTMVRTISLELLMRDAGLTGATAPVGVEEYPVLLPGTEPAG